MLAVVPISSAAQPQPAYTHSQFMGGGNETRLKVPISEEVERTKLSIKQKAAELTKKTRGSFRRKNDVGGGADDRAGRKLKLPRERQATQRQRSATKNRRKMTGVIDVIDVNDDHDNDDDDEDGNRVSCRIID